MCWEDVVIGRSARTVRHTLALANGQRTLLRANPDRIAVICTIGTLGGGFVSDDPAVTPASGIPFGNTVITTKEFLLRDYGQFVTGPLYFTAGANQNATVWEVIVDTVTVQAIIHRSPH